MKFMKLLAIIFLISCSGFILGFEKKLYEEPQKDLQLNEHEYKIISGIVINSVDLWMNHNSTNEVENDATAIDLDYELPCEINRFGRPANPAWIKKGINQDLIEHKKICELIQEGMDQDQMLQKKISELIQEGVNQLGTRIFPYFFDENTYGKFDFTRILSSVQSTIQQEHANSLKVSNWNVHFDNKTVAFQVDLKS